MPYQCQNCERDILIDTLVDSDLWKEISPTQNEGGLLCAACIADRISFIRKGKPWAALRMLSANI